jgi:hypothetical protein
VNLAGFYCARSSAPSRSFRWWVDFIGNRNNDRTIIITTPIEIITFHGASTLLNPVIIDANQHAIMMPSASIML